MDIAFCTNCGAKQPLEEIQGGKVYKQKRKSSLLIVIASIFIVVSLIGGYICGRLIRKSIITRRDRMEMMTSIHMETIAIESDNEES
jgi:hypothetical protein